MSGLHNQPTAQAGAAASALEESMWADLPIPKPPEELAHYTTLEALEGIVASQEFWMSNPLSMNDTQELHYGMRIGYEKLVEETERRRSEPGVQRLRHYARYHYEQFNEGHSLNTYVLCLASHLRPDGNLSMWRAYAADGNGVAVIINTSRLPTPLGGLPSPFVFSEIDYRDSDWRTGWVERTVKQLIAELPAEPMSNEDTNLVAFNFIERLKIFALFTKHGGFDEEKEYRIAFMSQRPGAEFLEDQHSYVLKQGRMRPILKLPFRYLSTLYHSEISLDNLVTQIVLGPMHNSAASVDAVKRMLKERGAPELVDRVTASQIPYRPRQ